MRSQRFLRVAAGLTGRAISSWRFKRSLFDPSWSYWLAFLVFLILFNCYYHYFMINSTFRGPHGDRGLPINLQGYLSSDAVLDFGADDLLVEPAITACLGIPSQSFDALCIIIDDNADARVVGSDSSRFGHDLSHYCRSKGELNVVVLTCLYVRYGDWIEILDKIQQAAQEGCSGKHHIWLIGGEAQDALFRTSQ